MEGVFYINEGGRDYVLKFYLATYNEAPWMNPSSSNWGAKLKCELLLVSRGGVLEGQGKEYWRGCVISKAGTF